MGANGFLWGFSRKEVTVERLLILEIGMKGKKFILLIFLKNHQGRVGKTTKGPVWLLSQMIKGIFVIEMFANGGKIVLPPGRFSYHTKKV